MARHKAAWWQKRVDELGRGGDVETLAQRYNVRARTLCWWRAEVARRAREETEPPTMLPVVVAPEPSAASAVATVATGDLEVVVEVGAARVSLRGAVTVAHLESIVRGLVARC